MSDTKNPWDGLIGLGDYVGQADGTYGLTPEQMAEWRKRLDAAGDLLQQMVKFVEKMEASDE